MGTPARFGSILTSKISTPRPPISSLTDLTGGTIDGTLQKVEIAGGLTGLRDGCNNNFAELNAKINEILASLQTCKWM